MRMILIVSNFNKNLHMEIRNKIVTKKLAERNATIAKYANYIDLKIFKNNSKAE